MNAAPGEADQPGAAGFPWDEAMTAGFSLLGLAPAEFWRMTPREFARAVAPFAAERHEAIPRASLVALMAQFPDQTTR